MESYNLLPETETKEFDGRQYLNPNLQVEQTDKFIDNFRSTQQANRQEIANQTNALGTDVPSVEGGLAGSGSYWTSRYQTPQNSALVADLRATAQAKALNDALSNEQAMWQKRYTEAYRAYQKRQHDANKTPQTPSDEYDGGLDYEDTGATTGLDAVQDVNQYGTTSTVYDSTQQSSDSRSTERDKQIEVTKDSDGNISTLIINGVPHYGREARARYRYLKNAGLVR